MDNPLSRYLHDHLAGSSFAVELLERLASEFTGTSSAEIARELLVQVQLDRQTLEQLIATVGKTGMDLYDGLGWIAERVIESNSDTTSHPASELSRRSKPLA